MKTSISMLIAAFFAAFISTTHAAPPGLGYDGWRGYMASHEAGWLHRWHLSFCKPTNVMAVDLNAPAASLRDGRLTLLTGKVQPLRATAVSAAR